MPSRRRVGSPLMTLLNSINSEMCRCPLRRNHRRQSQIGHIDIYFPPQAPCWWHPRFLCHPSSSLTPMTHIPGADYSLISKQCHRWWRIFMICSPILTLTCQRDHLIALPRDPRLSHPFLYLSLDWVYFRQRREAPGPGARRLSHQSLVVWLWESQLSCPGLNFLICTMRCFLRFFLLGWFFASSFEISPKATAKGGC